MTIAIWSLFTLLAFTSVSAASVCTPHFSREDSKGLGWQGADVAYSIPLNAGRDLWIFGDTLYGEKRVVHGNEPRMVHNSLGISTCDADGAWHIQYVLRHNRESSPQSYFSPANPKHWYWAMDGFAFKGDLWITLLCVEATDIAQSAMGFKTCGSDLAHVSHLERDPQDWEVAIQPLVPEGVKAYPSAAAVVQHGFAYLFAVYESGSRPLLVTRIRLNALSNAAEHIEYLAADGRWKHGLVPDDAKEVMTEGAAELSIRYHPELKRWLGVMFDPKGFSENIVLRTSPQMTGPWTKGSVIYQVPEMSPGSAHENGTFCYAAKEHIELEKPAQLLLTYVCNTMNIPSLSTNLGIYIPRTVTIPMADIRAELSVPD